MNGEKLEDVAGTEDVSESYGRGGGRGRGEVSAKKTRGAMMMGKAAGQRANLGASEKEARHGTK